MMEKMKKLVMMIRLVGQKQRQCRYMKMHIRTMLQITLHYFVVPYKLRDTIPQVGLLSLFPGLYLRLVL